MPLNPFQFSKFVDLSSIWSYTGMKLYEFSLGASLLTNILAMPINGILKCLCLILPNNDPSNAHKFINVKTIKSVLIEMCSTVHKT